MKPKMTPKEVTGMAWYLAHELTKTNIFVYYRRNSVTQHFHGAEHMKPNVTTQQQ